MLILQEMTSSESATSRNYVKRAGPYLLGMTLGNSPVDCITNCLGRKDGTDEFFVLKILKLQDKSLDDQQGKILLHTEYLLLNYLKGEPGIIQEHGLFRDEAIDATGQKVTRLCLVLDCFVSHDFSPEYRHLTNLQYHVIEVKRLSEAEAINIFTKVLIIIQRLHKINIVHRDLKLGNIIMNKMTGEIRLANFCLGKHLTSESELLVDQRGSPAYISPDVIKGEPYLGKPSDMWALGVILYTVLFAQFPFYDPCPSELFRKIKACEYTIPSGTSVSSKCVELIQSLLVLDPKTRLTCDQVLEKLDLISTTYIESPLQVVPDLEDKEKNESEDSKLSKFEKRSSKLSISRVKEEARTLTYRDLKKIYSVYQSKDPNIKKFIKRL